MRGRAEARARGAALAHEPQQPTSRPAISNQQSATSNQQPAITHEPQQPLARLVFGHGRVGARREVLLQTARRHVGRADDDRASVAAIPQRARNLGACGHVSAPADLAAQVLVDDDDGRLRARRHDNVSEAPHRVIGVGGRKARGREHLRGGKQRGEAIRRYWRKAIRRQSEGNQKAITEATSTRQLDKQSEGNRRVIRRQSRKPFRQGSSQSDGAFEAGCHQRQSEAIRGNRKQSDAPLRRDAAARVAGSTPRTPCASSARRLGNRPSVPSSPERPPAAEHAPRARAACNQQQSEAIRSNQEPSEAALT